MSLADFKSNCESRQKIIVSRDTGRRVHRAINKDAGMVRQYRLDADVFPNIKCCDYLVLNDTKKNAYYIELKGRDIGIAVIQLEAGEKLCREELPDYNAFFRIVSSRSNTHEINGTAYRKFKARYGDRFGCKEDVWEEVI